MNLYESQAISNLRDAKEISKANGTWNELQYEIEDAISTVESLSFQPDDDFKDVYDISVNLRNRA